MSQRVKPSPRTGKVPAKQADEVSAKRGNPFTRLLRRLRTAWRVLIGRIDPNVLENAQMAANAPVPVIRTALSPVHLKAKWWARGPDLNPIRSMVRRELMERASDLIEYSEEGSPDGGYYVSGDLYIYQREREEAQKC